MAKTLFTMQQKPLLFNDLQAYTKRESRLFDVTMVPNKGAAVRELVWNYLLYEILKLYEKKNTQTWTMYLDSF